MTLAVAYCVIVAAVASADVGGTVYKELPVTGPILNTYGVRDANEPGISGVTVTVMGSTGASTTVTTAADGSWTASGVFGDVRVVFSNLPSGLKTSDANSTVIFSSDGDTAINLGLYDPVQYLTHTATPTMVVPIYVNGDASGGGSGTIDVLFSLPYDNSAAHTPIAQASQVGAVWGNAYHAASDTLFLSAITKRHADYGPLGISGIYAVRNAKTSPTVSSFINLSSVNPAFDAGNGIVRDFSPGGADPDSANYDPGVFTQIGRAGLGGMDSSSNDRYLFVQNLYDRKLWRVEVGRDGVPPSSASQIVPFTAYPNPCTASTYRPFAVTVHAGYIYTGGVCDGISDLDDSTSAVDRNNLKAVIYRVPETIDPSTATWEMVKEFPLTYNRDAFGTPSPWTLFYNRRYRDPNGIDASLHDTSWHPWARPGDVTGEPSPNNKTYTHVYAQPMFLSMEFDKNDGIVVTLGDRTGFQWGYYNYFTDSSDPRLHHAVGLGDILRLSYDGSSYELEHNGTVGGLSSAGANNGDGPGGGEFFFQDVFDEDAGGPFHTDAPLLSHEETTIGGGALIPGSDTVVVPVMDPVDSFDTGGVRWYSMVDGTVQNGRELYTKYMPMYFSKASGVGDVEVLRDPAPFEIGNRIWHDSGSGITGADNNGIQDPGEPGIGGIVVTLTCGTQTAETTTAADGTYYFRDGFEDVATWPGGILPRNATDCTITVGVHQTPLAGLGIVAPDQGTDDALDSDATESNGIATITIPDTGDGIENIHTFDIGFAVQGVSVGDYVWEDANANGIQDAGESPISGATVELFSTVDGGTTVTPAVDKNGTAVSSQTTGGDGAYLFTNLPDGDYIVRVTPPSGYSPTPVQQTDPNIPDNTDSNIDTTRIVPGGAYESGVVSLSVGTEVLDGDSNDNHHPGVDFGFVKTLSLGDYVWEDVNANGIQDPGEPGIPGVTLSLLVDDGTGTFVPATDAFGATVPTQTTDANGIYRFTGLATGTYRVVVDASNWTAGGVFASGGTHAGFIPSPGNGGDNQDNTDDNGDNDGIVAPTGGVRSASIALSPGSEPVTDGDTDPNSDRTIDFGFYGYALGNRVWFDTDNSGAQDSGEPGIAGVTVELLDAARNPIDADTDTPGVQPMTTVTDSNGYYIFENLPAGDYIVRIAAANFSPPQPLATYISATGAQGEEDPNTDGDANDNGLDPSHALYPGAVTDEGIISNIVTVGPGTVEPTGEDGSSVLPDAVANLTVDFGIINPVLSLGDYVWEDVNANGIQDPGEPGIPGVTLSLLVDDGTGTFVPAQHLDGTAVADTTTDTNGAYTFSQLPDGDYVVRVTLPSGYIPTTIQQPSPETTDNTDSNFDLSRTAPSGSYESGVVTLTVGAETGDGDADSNRNQSVDFGVILDPSIGNRVWNDYNANGIQDPGEPGIPGVTLSLLVDDGTGTFVPAQHLDGTAVADITTDLSGHYNFSNLPNGTYKVVVAGSNWTAGGVFASGGTHAGFIPSPGDGGDNQDNTDDNGDNDGTTTPSSVTSQPIVLAAGTEPVNEDAQETLGNNNSDLTIDFGFYGYALGNRVWFDTDNSGAQDSGEPGIAGVTVELLRADGSSIDRDALTPGMQPTVTTTDANGYYVFYGLSEGDYRVRVTAENFDGGNALYNHYQSFGSSQEEDPNTDGDANDNGLDPAHALYPGAASNVGVWSGIVTLGGMAEPISEDGALATIPDNRTNLTVDFGFFTPVSLGDYVWDDMDVDGVQDSTEDPIGGVVLTLFSTTDGGVTITPAVDVNGVAVAPAITTPNGRYAFTQIPPGQYIVRVTPPAGTAWVATLTNTASPDVTDNTDSNFDLSRTAPSGSYESGVVTLTVGGETADGDTNDDNNPSVDFGFFKPMSVGNRVWLDRNRNGLFDTGETPVRDVEISLLMDNGAGSFVPATDVAGNPVPHAITDADGYYMFTRLNPGRYKIVVVPENWTTGPFSSQQTLSDARGTVTTGSDNGVNNDNNGNNADIPSPADGIVSDVITLTAGAEATNEDAREIIADPNSDLTIDFGVYTPVGIGNYVWLDADADGIQDNDEYGIENVRIVLYKDDGTGTFVPATDTQGAAVSAQMTDANGYYFFDNLRPGTYRVHVTADNWQTGVFDATAVLSGALPSPGNGGDTQNNTDDNGDGDHAVVTQDIVSDSITLYSQDEPILEDEQEPGADADTDRTIDFGFYTPVSIGDTVWLDADADGVQDPDEQGVAGVCVALYMDDGTGTFVDATDAQGVAISTQVTDAQGHYLFDNLRPGTYRVRLCESNWQTGGVFENGDMAGARGTRGGDNDNNDNRDNTDDNGNRDNVARPNGIDSEAITLRSQDEPSDEGDTDRDTDLTIDFGVYTPVGIGDRVWYDTNVNGIQDAGEPGIADVQLVLEYEQSPGTWTDTITDVNGATVTTHVRTDANGIYGFSNLFPGTYRVRLLRDNWADGAPFGRGGIYVGAFGTKGRGEDTPDNTDDNGDQDYRVNPPQDLVTTPIVLRSTQERSDGDSDDNNNPSVDFGIARGMDLGNRVWLDADGDGIHDDGERGIDGVEVALYTADAPYTIVDTTVTADGGYYHFDNLPPGRYIVVITARNFTDSGALDDLRSSGIRYDESERRAPAVDDDERDRDDNGMWDTRDGVFDDTVTSSVVTLHPEPGEPTGETDCPRCASDPTPDFLSNMTVDFGFYKPASLGNRVWLDENRNGVQDEGEHGVRGVTVKLYDERGKRLDKTKTNKQGRYRFTDLPPGTYRVRFETPTGYVFTSRHTASNTGDDSDARKRNGKTQYVTLRSGEDYPRLDAGIVTETLAQTGSNRPIVGILFIVAGVMVMIYGLWGLRRRRKRNGYLL